MQSEILLTGATATGYDTTYVKGVTLSYQNASFTAIVSGTGVVSATVEIYVSNQPSRDTTGASDSGWALLGALSPSGTTSGTDAISSSTPYMWTRAKVTALASGATVTCNG